MTRPRVSAETKIYFLKQKVQFWEGEKNKAEYYLKQRKAEIKQLEKEMAKIES